MLRKFCSVVGARLSERVFDCFGHLTGSCEVELVSWMCCMAPVFFLFSTYLSAGHSAGERSESLAVLGCGCNFTKPVGALFQSLLHVPGGADMRLPHPACIPLDRQHVPRLLAGNLPAARGAALQLVAVLPSMLRAH